MRFEGQAHKVVGGARNAGGKRSRVGKGVTFSEALLSYLFENRFDGVEREVFPAMLGLESGEGEEVLQAASKLRVKKRIG